MEQEAMPNAVIFIEVIKPIKMKAQDKNDGKVRIGPQHVKAWIKVGRLYRTLPVLKYIDPLFIPFVILLGGLAYVIATAEPVSCNCAQQIRDERLIEMAKEGNIEVAQYLNQIDDFWNCNTRRKALLHKLNLSDQ